MEDKKLISVIMAEYNTDANLLKESIKSILNQTYKNFELILIDDCGKNDLKNIVDEFNDARIKLYKNENNKGLVFSLNRALKLANGEYIARMDTDDFSYKDRLQKQIDFLEKNKNIDVVGANVDYYDGKEIWGSSNLKGKVNKEQILNTCPLMHPTIMARKKVFLEVGGYPNYKRGEDYALWIELFSKNYTLYNMEDKVLKYHLSIEDYKKRNLKTRREVFKILDEQYIKLEPKKIQIIKMKIKNFIAGIAPYKIIYNYHRKKNRRR